MYEIHEGREQITLHGMSREDWELFTHVVMNLMDDGGTLYPGTYTNDETVGDTYWSTEHDSEMNIMAAFVSSKEDGDDNSEVVFDKMFFELYIMHVCREVFGYEIDRQLWIDDGVDPRFWDIADEISRAWPHPHIDW